MRFRKGRVLWLAVCHGLAWFAVVCVFLGTPARSFADAYEHIEASFDITNLTTDPFDYTVTDVEVQITQPDGSTVTLPAFFDGGTTWRVRHTPMLPGVYQITNITMNGSALAVGNLQPTTWTVAGNPISPGYIQIDPTNASRFITSNGRRYFPVGENIAWNQSGVLITNVMARMSAAHENWGRIWTTYGDNKNLDWPSSGTNLPFGQLLLTNAQNWDNIVNAAEQNGICFQMTLQSHFEYNATIQFTFWPRNPYNVANGGFLSSTTQFFTNAMAMSLTERKLRYSVARWGYSTAIMAWELFNEVEYTDAAEDNQINNIQTWHDTMALFLRAQDRYHHLITTSADVYLPIWTNCDYYQHHDYPQNGYIDGLRDTQGLPTGPIKPIFAGECGTNGTPDLGVNVSLWTGLMSGQSGNAEPWWWWLTDPGNDYIYFRAVSDFIRLSGLPEQDAIAQSAPTVTSPSSLLNAYQIGNDQFAALWLWNSANVFLTNASMAVSGTFPLSGLSAGTYSGTWWDTYAGVPVSTFTFTATGSAPVTISTPPILRTMALYVGLPPQAGIVASNFTQTVSNSSASFSLPIVLTNGGGLPFTYSLSVTGASSVAYTATDSTQPGGPVYAWQDISAIGSDITTNLTDEGMAGPLNIGFGFPFFSGAQSPGIYTQLYVSPDGFVTFSPFSGDQSTNLPLPNSSAPTNLIAPFWCDLDLTSGNGHVYAASDALAGTFTLQYQNVPIKNSSATVWCQLILKTTGEILIQYRAVGISNACTVGLQNAAGNSGVTLAFNQNYLQSSFAVSLTPTPWLGFSSNAGLVPRTNADTINVTVNPAALNAGANTATLLITTSDTNEPVFAVPVEMDVPLSPRALWRQTYFGTTANAGIAADTADPDGDGLINIVEYAFGTNPTIPNTLPMSGALVGNNLVVTFTRPHPAPSDITYIYEVTDDLAAGTWQSGDAFTTETVTDNMDGTETVVVMDNLPVSESTAHYVRIRISSP